MKNGIFLILALLLLSCGASAIRTTPSPQVVNVSSDGSAVEVEASSPNVEKAPLEAEAEKLKYEEFSNATRIGGIMNFLASDELKGRDSGSEGIAKAADFIETIFKQNNIKPYFKSYRDTLSNFSPTAYNMVGMVEGTDPILKDQYIVIGAHYDHIGLIKPENGDFIANGANDNASGTTTVLEFARYFGNRQSSKRSLIFALFSAEEKGLLGSKHLAERLKAENIDLYTMLNFEMTGVPLAGKDYFLYITGYEKSNLAGISNSYADEKLIGFLRTAREFNLFQRSDNYPFHQTFNVPSHTYCTFDFTNFNYYHKVGDEVSEMDFGHMAEVVNRMIPVLEGISNAPTKEIQY